MACTGEMWRKGVERRFWLKEWVAERIRGGNSNVRVEMQHPAKEVGSKRAVIARLDQSNRQGGRAFSVHPSNSYQAKISRVAGCDAKSLGCIEGKCGL